MQRIVKWKLIEGSNRSQETSEQKMAEGIEYIEKLRVDENVVSVVETKTELIITLEGKETPVAEPADEPVSDPDPVVEPDPVAYPDPEQPSEPQP